LLCTAVVVCSHRRIIHRAAVAWRTRYAHDVDGVIDRKGGWGDGGYHITVGGHFLRTSLRQIKKMQKCDGRHVFRKEIRIYLHVENVTMLKQVFAEQGECCELSNDICEFSAEQFY
jgi:hypothetical protein